ncbi:3-hydroxyacyl-CoA dehydrogenase NAD-binding domain-containing protein [Pseudomonas thivervalensis]|uniref:3-hydroxyacyl-CoA dehydrogenase NAD-binding domain-containing protein n=1 Tax=Pseudomonas thivervalensis TaxID=86265 RepID=UPI00069D89C7|nr:3-hydroxyacyl-CoA dehydrogenase NAD-binding domain-containing protein [Pseudomonas thivervalensis]
MTLIPLEKIKTVGLAGAGAVGYGWAALLLARGYNVIACDPAEEAQTRLEQAVIERWPSLRRLGVATSDHPPFERLQFATSLAQMAKDSDLVQENAPENPAIKSDVISEIDAHLPADRLILSSSGGVPPSQLQSYCQAPERLVLGHPFHPAHIIPLVEVVGGAQSSPEAVELALQFYRGLGKYPIHLKREMVGHLSNRLQFALLREAAHCLATGVASASDIDAAIRWGLGPRWALMGGLMTFNLAGGSGGLSSLLDRFGDDIQRWWDALEPTQLTPAVRSALVAGAQELTAEKSNDDWAQWRDETLIEFFRFVSEHPFPSDQ